MSLGTPKCDFIQGSFSARLHPLSQVFLYYYVYFAIKSSPSQKSHQLMAQRSLLVTVFFFILSGLPMLRMKSVCWCIKAIPLSAGTWEAPVSDTKFWVLGVSSSFPGINLPKLFYGCPEQEWAGSGSGQKQDGIVINPKQR
jgi:hypothetical protein